MMPIRMAVLADHNNILDRRFALAFADRVQVMDVNFGESRPVHAPAAIRMASAGQTYHGIRKRLGRD